MFCRKCGRKVFETKRRVWRGTNELSVSAYHVKSKSHTLPRNTNFLFLYRRNLEKTLTRFMLDGFPSSDLINEIDCPEQRAVSRLSVVSRVNFSFNAATANYGKHVCVSSGFYQCNFEQERPGGAISNGRWCICAVCVGGSGRFARDVSENPMAL